MKIHLIKVDFIPSIQDSFLFSCNLFYKYSAPKELFVTPKSLPKENTIPEG